MELKELMVIDPQSGGNSPRMNFIKELNIHMAKRDFQFFYDNITDDIQWSILGLQKLKGKEKITEVIEGMKIIQIIELNFKSIITYGTAGAVNAVVTLDNHDQYAYCSIYVFTNNEKSAMIKEVTTYFHKHTPDS